MKKGINHPKNRQFSAAISHSSLQVEGSNSLKPVAGVINGKSYKKINMLDIRDGDIVHIRCGGKIEAKNVNPSCGLWFKNSHYWYETLDGFVMESRIEHPFDITAIERMTKQLKRTKG